MVFRDLMEFMGVDTRRVTFSWVSAAEGAKWAALVNDVTDGVRALGPYAEYEDMSRKGVA
jgi:coenzyme F420-reducing hydrogenase delta subunit